MYAQRNITISSIKTKKGKEIKRNIVWLGKACDSEAVMRGKLIEDGINEDGAGLRTLSGIDPWAGKPSRSKKKRGSALA